MKDFTNVKVGDKLLVVLSHYGDPDYYTGTVTNVTKTRFTLNAVCFGQGSQQFTKDGNQYPRSSGWGRVYIHLKEYNDEAKDLIKKHQFARKVIELAYEVKNLLADSDFRKNLVNEDIAHAELDETMAVLQKTMDHLKKYKK